MTDPTEPLPVTGGAGEPLPVTGGAGGDDIHPEDPDDDWAAASAPSGMRIRRLTGVLVLLVALVGGFWGGALAEKHHGNPTSSSALASRLAALRSGRGASAGASTGTGAGAGAGASLGAGGSGFGGGTSGFGTGGAGGSPATSGLVTEIQGPLVYVTDQGGNLVKVTLSPSTRVTRTATGTAGPLAVGDSVVVRGTKSADGSVTATAVVATAAGAAAPGAAAGAATPGSG
jgi:hypothetical protein